jgi:hypothetical protein
MKYVSLIFLIVFFANCGSKKESHEFPKHSAVEMESDFSKCPNGAIPAIFDNDTSGLVKNQNFVTSKSSVTETVTFASGVELTLEQSGCKVLKQRYSFKFAKTPAQQDDTPNLWKALAIVQFQEMTEINEGFNVLTQIIQENAEAMQLGQPIQGEDYVLTIDKFTENNKPILVVSFDLIYPE